MGSGEAGTPTKTPKTSSAQDQPSPPAPYPPEWAAALQAYYNGGTPPPGYFPPSVASGPQPHPYMWGAQPMMPPYGTPPPYGTMYPPYGMPGPHPYGQYGMPVPGSTNDASTAAATDTDGKSSDGKEKSPMKRSKGSLGSLGMLSKSADGGKSGSANGVVSQSGDSGSEGSSDGSDEDQNGTEKRNMEQMNAEGSAMGNAGQPGYAGQVGSAFVSPGVPNQAGGKNQVGTNLNMGIDYWGAGAPGTQSSGKGKRSSQAMVPAMAGGQMMGHGRDGVPPELWLQDERELKRQRRKQSNRESARRSRLRKQAECEELAQRVDSLTVENMSLRQELEQVVEERNKLAAENASLLEQLQKGGAAGEPVATHELGTSEAGTQLQGDESGNADGLHETNGRVAGENCETVGKAALDAASRGEAVAAAG